VGQLTILRLREKARQQLGDKFSLSAFHDEVIGAGALVLQDLPPMAVCKGTAAEVSRVPSNRLKGL